MYPRLYSSLDRDARWDSGIKLHEHVARVGADGIVVVDAGGHPARYDHRSGHWDSLGHSPEWEDDGGPWTIVHVPVAAKMADIIYCIDNHDVAAAVWDGTVGPILLLCAGGDANNLRGFGHGPGQTTTFATHDGGSIDVELGQRVRLAPDGTLDVVDH